MKAFLWVMLVLFGLTFFVKLSWLAKGKFPERKAGEEACDVVINLFLVNWAAILLYKVYS